MAISTTLVSANDTAELAQLVSNVISALSVSSVMVDYAIDTTNGVYSVLILNE